MTFDITEFVENVPTDEQTKFWDDWWRENQRLERQLKTLDTKIRNSVGSERRDLETKRKTVSQQYRKHQQIVSVKPQRKEQNDVNI